MLSEYGSVACLVERPTRQTQAEQYWDTIYLKGDIKQSDFAMKFIRTQHVNFQ